MSTGKFHRFDKKGKTELQRAIETEDIVTAKQILEQSMKIDLLVVLSSLCKQYREAEVKDQRAIINFHNSVLCGQILQHYSSADSGYRPTNENVIKYRAHITCAAGAYIDGKLSKDEPIEIEETTVKVTGREGEGLKTTRLTGFHVSSFIPFRIFHMLEIFLKLYLGEISDLDIRSLKPRTKLIEELYKEIKREVKHC